MIVKIKIPSCFVPEEREFQIYSAIKLYKGKYIDKEDAIKMCGYSENDEISQQKFNELYQLFEKRYKKICGAGYADGDFKNDLTYC